jgi:hypothetical protein
MSKITHISKWTCGPGFKRKGVKAMQILKSKKVMLLLISLASIFALGVTTSIAQEKIKFSGKQYWVVTKVEVMNVDDIEGHVLSLGESKGVDVVTGDQFVTKGSVDLVKGNGSHWGYSKVIDKDGDVRFIKYEGKVTTTLSPEGKPIITTEDTFSLIKGTGKWENAHGGGHAKNNLQSISYLTKQENHERVKIH